MRKKSLLIIFIIFNIFCFSGNAQDAMYTNNLLNEVYTNPGFAGSKDMLRISLNNQMLWYSAIHNTSFNSFSADFAVKNLGIGIGGAYNQIGHGYKQNNADVSFSYKIGDVRKFIIRPGIKVSYMGMRFDWDELIFYDQLSVYDGVLAQGSAATYDVLNFNILDVSAGFVSQFPIMTRKIDPIWVNFGFAMHHIPEHDFSISGLAQNYYPHKYTFHGGILLPFYHKDPVTKHLTRSNFLLYPNFKYQLQDRFSLINGGLIAYYSLNKSDKEFLKNFSLIGGLAFQTFHRINIFSKNQVIGTMGFDVPVAKYYNLQFLYSIDWGVSLNTHMKNSSAFITHEFSIVILFANKRWSDASTKRKFDKKRWYNNNEVQQRKEGEAAYGKTPRREAKYAKPVFYPFELPKAYIGF